MPKILTLASYTAEGAKGLLKDGGSKRRTAVEQLINSLGGTLEAFYFAFGENDIIAITDVPDNATAAEAGLVTKASGAASGKSIVLLTPEEIDQATQKTVDYQPPGQ